MSFMSKVKSFFGRGKKEQPQPTAKVVVTKTTSQQLRDDGKTRRSYMAKQWAAILERRRRDGLRTDKATRRVLRSKLARKDPSRRSRRVA